MKVVVDEERRQSLRPALLRRPRQVRSTPYTQHDLEVLGFRLRYIDVPARDRTRSGVPLLLIHGHTSRIEEYDALIPHLSEYHRVLVCDLPGCGYSDKPHGHPYTLRLYEDVLLGFLDALRVQQAHVAGGSLGGNLVLRLGYRCPARFQRLIAWSPAGAWVPTQWLGRVLRMVGNSMLFWPMVWGQSRYWYPKNWPGRHRALAETFAYYREVSCKGFHRMYWDVVAEQLEQSHFTYAHEIHQPTLLAWGDQDHGLNMGQGVQRLKELIPNSRLEVFAGARHCLANEIPEDLAQIANGFLSEGDTGDLVASAS
ncbi:MAG: alpha/beta hydrolase [Myxococcales bacterium]|nr:alpha/beta hydrolase [Myxococcales bacterium]